MPALFVEALEALPQLSCRTQCRQCRSACSGHDPCWGPQSAGGGFGGDGGLRGVGVAGGGVGEAVDDGEPGGVFGGVAGGVFGGVGGDAFGAGAGGVFGGGAGDVFGGVGGDDGGDVGGFGVDGRVGDSGVTAVGGVQPGLAW